MIVVHTKSMIEMDDPKIISYASPLSHQEKLEQKPVNFAEEGFGVGVTTYVNGYPSFIPLKVGRLKAYRIFDEFGYHREELKLKNMDQFMSDKYHENMHSGILLGFRSGLVYGVDPAEWNLNQYSDLTETKEYILTEYEFELCKAHKDKDFKCLDDEKMKTWFLSNTVTMKWGYIQTKFDFFAKENYIFDELAII